MEEERAELHNILKMQFGAAHEKKQSQLRQEENSNLTSDVQ